jgi:hypothetical protein
VCLRTCCLRFIASSSGFIQQQRLGVTAQITTFNSEISIMGDLVIEQFDGPASFSQTSLELDAESTKPSVEVDSESVVDAFTPTQEGAATSAAREDGVPISDQYTGSQADEAVNPTALQPLTAADPSYSIAPKAFDFMPSTSAAPLASTTNDIAQSIPIAVGLTKGEAGPIQDLAATGQGSSPVNVPLTSTVALSDLAANEPISPAANPLLTATTVAEINLSKNANGTANAAANEAINVAMQSTAGLVPFGVGLPSANAFNALPGSNDLPTQMSAQRPLPGEAPLAVMPNSLDPATTVAALNGGVSLSGGKLLPVGVPPGGGGVIAQRSNEPGSAIRVEPLLTTEEQKRLHARLQVNDPSLNNYMIDNNSALSGAALLTYVRGKSDLVRLPDDFSNSKHFYADPAASNTNTLINRALTNQSKTPSAARAYQKLNALKEGESFTFSDHNNKLVTVRDQIGNMRSDLVREEKDRAMTMGDVTFNTNSDVKVTNLGAKGYQIEAKSVHTILDRYNWNATARDSAESAARMTALPDGAGSAIFVNHADWAAMKPLGAKDYTLGLVAKETRVYTIPKQIVEYSDPTGTLINERWEPKVDEWLSSKSKPQTVASQDAFRSNLLRASSQNKNLVPVPNTTAQLLNPVKYDPKAGSFETPANPARPGRPTQ